MSSARKEILAPDPAAIRTVVGHFATGVAIIAVPAGGEHRLQHGRPVAGVGAQVAVCRQRAERKLVAEAATPFG